MADEELSLTRRLEMMHEFHFELAAADGIDELCRRAVDRGRSHVGMDRIGVWFLDPADAHWFHGSFGIDENGNVRDERAARVRRDPAIYDDDFFQRRIQFRRWKQSPIYDERHNIVGHGELIVAPVWNGTDSIGALAADNHITGRESSEEDCQLLVLLARMIGHLVTIKRTEQRLRESALELEELATIDGLTGLLNRSTGIRILHHQVTLSRRTAQPLTVCFLDLDGLKQINDEQGHQRGDDFINSIAQLIDRAKRESDAACRMGGDEFMIVLPQSTTADAAALMERLAELARESPDLQRMRPEPWYSYGMAELDTAREPAHNSTEERSVVETVEEIIHQADLRMYEQKRTHATPR